MNKIKLRSKRLKQMNNAFMSTKFDCWVFMEIETKNVFLNRGPHGFLESKTLPTRRGQEGTGKPKKFFFTA